MLADVIQINISKIALLLHAIDIDDHAFILYSSQKGSHRHLDKASLLYLNSLKMKV